MPLNTGYEPVGSGQHLHGTSRQSDNGTDGPPTPPPTHAAHLAFRDASRFTTNQ